MKTILSLSLFLLLSVSTYANESASPVKNLKCTEDKDCNELGKGYKCIMQKMGCPENPTLSTCAQRICVKSK